MSPVLIATVAGLITAICWGTGDWLSAKSTKVLSTIQINLGVSLVNLPLLIGFYLFADITLPTLGQFLAIFTASSLITLAYMIFVRALRDGAVGVIVPLGNSYPLVTVVLSIVLLSQVFLVSQVMAMVIIVLGAGLLAYQKNSRKIPLAELHKDTLLAVVAALIWGVGFFVLNSVIGDLSWQTIAFFMEVVGFISAIVLLVAAYPTTAWTAAKETITYPIILIAGLVGAIGFLAIYIGSDRAGSAVIPTVLSGCGPLVASFLGATFDHEKLGPLKRAGAVLVVLGIVILNLA